MKQKIAWVVDSEYIRPLEERLNEAGFEIERYEHIIPALRAFDETRYDAILLNPMVAPGLIRSKEIRGGYEPGPYDNDPRIEAIAKEYRGQNRNPDYWKFAMYAIEVAHGPTSPNARTPILVVGVNHEKGDFLFPNAEETCKAAGAIDYYNIGRDERYNAVIRDILNRK